MEVLETLAKAILQCEEDSRGRNYWRRCRQIAGTLDDQHHLTSRQEFAGIERAAPLEGMRSGDDQSVRVMLRQAGCDPQ